MEVWWFMENLEQLEPLTFQLFAFSHHFYYHLLICKYSRVIFPRFLILWLVCWEFEMLWGHSKIELFEGFLFFVLNFSIILVLKIVILNYYLLKTLENLPKLSFSKKTLDSPLTWTTTSTTSRRHIRA